MHDRACCCHPLARLFQPCAAQSTLVRTASPPPLPPNRPLLQAIVWTDEAVDRLLDRSTLHNPPEGDEDSSGGGGGGDILGGFKVAHFQLQETAAAEEGAEGGDAAGAAAHDGGGGSGSGGVSASGAGFWEGLLAGHWEAAQAAEAAVLGKGKRHRRKLVANLNQDAMLDAMLADDSGGDGSSSEEEGAGGRGRRGSAGASADGSSDCSGAYVRLCVRLGPSVPETMPACLRHGACLPHKAIAPTKLLLYLYTSVHTYRRCPYTTTPACRRRLPGWLGGGARGAGG